MLYVVCRARCGVGCIVASVARRGSCCVPPSGLRRVGRVLLVMCHCYVWDGWTHALGMVAIEWFWEGGRVGYDAAAKA